jgi:hypothetical protein
MRTDLIFIKAQIDRLSLMSVSVLHWQGSPVLHYALTLQIECASFTPTRILLTRSVGLIEANRAGQYFGQAVLKDFSRRGSSNGSNKYHDVTLLFEMQEQEHAPAPRDQ